MFIAVDCICGVVTVSTQPASTKAPKTNAPPAVGTSPQAKTNDRDPAQLAYQENRENRWNEHEYYVRARTDLQKHHHEKIAKVIVTAFIDENKEKYGIWGKSVSDRSKGATILST